MFCSTLLIGLHFLSKRWDQNYIKLNCAALSESLLESELFGYEAGAFTGASKKKLLIKLQSMKAMQVTGKPKLSLL